MRDKNMLYQAKPSQAKPSHKFGFFSISKIGIFLLHSFYLSGGITIYA